MAVDALGNIYVTEPVWFVVADQLDRGNSTIRRVTPGGVVTSLVGVSGKARVDLCFLPAGLNSPRGVAVLSDPLK